GLYVSVCAHATCEGRAEWHCTFSRAQCGFLEGFRRGSASSHIPADTEVRAERHVWRNGGGRSGQPARIAQSSGTRWIPLPVPTTPAGPGGPFQVKTTHLLAIAAVVFNVAGNYCLSVGMKQTGELVSVSPLDYLRVLLNPWVAVGVGLLFGWLIAQLSLLS